MKDYDLTLKIRNARLLNCMKEQGFANAPALSRASGISPAAIYAMLNLSIPAYIGDGITPRSPVKEVAEFLGVGIEEIYPESHLTDPLAKNQFNAQIEQEQMRQIAQSTEDPAKLLEWMETEERDSFEDMLDTSTLSDRDKEVLRLRFKEEKTYQEIAELAGVTSVRINQIISNGISRIRSSPKSKLEEAAGAYWDSENVVQSDLRTKGRP